MGALEKQTNPKALKHLINSDVVDVYGTKLIKVFKDFDHQSFCKLKNHLDELELRDRVSLIAHELANHLPSEYPKALRILEQAIEDGAIRGFALWPATEFVRLYGLDHFDDSFRAMETWTIMFTSEFAVRPFIIKYPDRSIQWLMGSAQNENVHIRRWASEGSRPRLPWGERLHVFVKDPSLSIKILEQLKYDPDLYVRKSVANHLNDISKDHPDLVIKILKNWKKKVAKNFSSEFEFTLRQSLRTLIRQGNPDALALMGVTYGDSSLAVSEFSLQSRKVKIGDSLLFTCAIINKSKQSKSFVVDYVIDYQKSNGAYSPKVFKLKKGNIPPLSTLVIKRKHSFKLVTTRTYYPGQHRMKLLLNGVVSDDKSFQLWLDS
jgi:3-methyladenine DNA glycosylase AlkC